MNNAAAQITNAAQRSANSGFAGIVADPTTRHLQVYWKGEPPANLVATARATVATQVLPAAYSQRELMVAADRLRAAAGNKITTVGPRADGAGLLVGTQDGLLGATALAGVPVTVQTRVAAAPATRWDDTRRGGVAPRGATPPPAAAARPASGSSRAGWRGCSPPRTAPTSTSLATDPTGQSIGIVGTRNAGTDTLLLAGSSGGRVFKKHRRGRQRGQRVQQPGDRRVGQPGRQLGVHLGRVLRHPVLDPGEGPQPLHQRARLRQVCGQVQAENTTHTNAVGQGDSGGPVEIVNAANTLQVWATGTNTAIDDTNTSTACTGYRPTGRVCAWRFYYEDIFSGMAGVGASGVVLG